MHININIAVPQIGDYDLPLFIADEIKKNGLNGSDITFEITETYQIKDIKSIQNFVHAIHRLGAEIALDDFGTGYSSLDILKAPSCGLDKNRPKFRYAGFREQNRPGYFKTLVRPMSLTQNQNLC